MSVNGRGHRCFAGPLVGSSWSAAHSTFKKGLAAIQRAVLRPVGQRAAGAKQKRNVESASVLPSYALGLSSAKQCVITHWRALRDTLSKCVRETARQSTLPYLRAQVWNICLVSVFT